MPCPLIHRQARQRWSVGVFLGVQAVERTIMVSVEFGGFAHVAVGRAVVRAQLRWWAREFAKHACMWLRHLVSHSSSPIEETTPR
jgi:hypothetical protein